MQKKILLFKDQNPLQVTIFHQSLLRHESAVAQSQQGPFQQLQTAAGSDAAWVCLLNRREQEAFCCLCCLKLDKAKFYNLLPLCLEHTFHRKLHWVPPAHCAQGMFHSACLCSQNVLLQQTLSHDRESQVGDGCEGCSQVLVQREVTELFPKSCKEQSAQASVLFPMVCWLLFHGMLRKQHFTTFSDYRKSLFVVR